jgi:hypothetical protein
MKCVSGKNGFGRDATIVVCVETRRDRDVTYARTLCRHNVLFPGATFEGTPTCRECLQILEKRKCRSAKSAVAAKRNRTKSSVRAVAGRQNRSK